MATKKMNEADLRDLVKKTFGNRCQVVSLERVEAQTSVSKKKKAKDDNERVRCSVCRREVYLQSMISTVCKWCVSEQNRVKIEADNAACRAAFLERRAADRELYGL